MSANVEITDTFDQWRTKSNEFIAMTQSAGSSNFLKLTNTTNSTSNTTGSIISTGGIGISKCMVIGEDLNVHGNIHANGAISADGSITLGDAATDNIVFNADVNSSIIPNTNGSFDIGNTSMYWSNGFFESIKLHVQYQNKISKLRSSLEHKKQIPLAFLDLVYMFEKIAQSWSDISDLVQPTYKK